MSDAVPLPALEGPIEITSDSQPSHGIEMPTGRGLALHALESGSSSHQGSIQYMEKEYFISGEGAGARYRTHLLVRRPADPSAFSGTVLLEPMHAAGAAPMSMFRDYVFGRGHGYVLVGAQRFPLENTVKAANSRRYAALFIGEPATIAEVEAPRVGSGDLTAESARIVAMMRDATRQKPVSHAILAQAGALVRDAKASLFGRAVRTLLMGGVSQTGMLVLDFINEAHVRTRLQNGAPVFDGYFPISAPGLNPVAGIDVPVVHMPNEGDFLMSAAPLAKNGKFSYRRDDSDGPQNPYRLYELAGCAHIPTWHTSIDEFRQIPGLAEALLPGERLAQFPGIMYRTAALDNLVQWVTNGTSPPRAERLGTTSPDEIARDEHGNALGGVRSSHLDVPIATYVACAPEPQGSSVNIRRQQLGLEMPFARDKLARMYRTNADYVARVTQRLDELVKGRWLLADDAALLAAEARQASIL